VRVPGIVAAALVAVLSIGVALAQTAGNGAEGTWSVAYSGERLGSNTITLHQQGGNVTGWWGEAGTLTGKVNAGNHNKVDVQWVNGVAHGWATFVFTHDWNSFSGEWGKLKKPYGTFEAERVVNVKLNTTGTWDVTLTGIEDYADKVTFTQKGNSVTGTWANNGRMTGTLTPGGVELRGMWHNGKTSGPLDLTFDPSGVIFEGMWSTNGSGPKGRIIGRRHPKF
jgi:hypothetical protein